MAGAARSSGLCPTHCRVNHMACYTGSKAEISQVPLTLVRLTTMLLGRVCPYW